MRERKAKAKAKAIMGFSTSVEMTDRGAAEGSGKVKADVSFLL
jgi:hypothetical protein